MWTRPLVIGVVAAATCAIAAAANAASPYLVSNPHHDHHHAYLPEFGMHSYSTRYGEQIVDVHHRGIARVLGLEAGDVVERFNNTRLNYHGAWRHALRDAMSHGGHIVLRVRDVRTGRLVMRHVDLDPHGHVIGGPIGPITPKAAPVVRRSVVDRPVPRAVPAIVSPRFTLRFGY